MTIDNVLKKESILSGACQTQVKYTQNLKNKEAK